MQVHHSKAKRRGSEFSFANHIWEEALASQAPNIQKKSDTVVIDIPEILTLLSNDKKLARSSSTRTRKIGGKRLDWFVYEHQLHRHVVYDGLCNMLLHTTHLWMSINQSGDVLILERGNLYFDHENDRNPDSNQRSCLLHELPLFHTSSQTSVVGKNT